MTINFEQSMKALEDLVQKLEKGDLSLEEALKHYENGVKTARQCQTLLDAAEKKINKLTDDDHTATTD